VPRQVVRTRPQKTKTRCHFNLLLTGPTSGIPTQTYTVRHHEYKITRQLQCFSTFLAAVPWFTQFVAGLSQRRHGFAPVSVNLRFVVDRVALWHVSVQVLRFSPAISFHHGSPFSYIYWMYNRSIGGSSSKIRLIPSTWTSFLVPHTPSWKLSHTLIKQEYRPTKIYTKIQLFRNYFTPLWK
jgi:hypothetical protein